MKTIVFVITLLITASLSTAQTNNAPVTDDSDDLLRQLDKDAPKPNSGKYVLATFKTTRIANGHSIENSSKGVLDIRINHRFGLLNDGLGNFFGLDNAITRLGVDYGILNQLMIGIGRSTYLKEYDSYLKWKLLRQTKDDKMPISVSLMSSASAQTTDVYAPAGKSYNFKNRLAYINQLLIARKFSETFSLQIAPTYLHSNLVQYNDDPNGIFAVGFGGRLKLSKRISLTGEYYMAAGNRLRNTHNSATIGFDIETGGHVFQLLFTNAGGITERTVLGQNTGRIDKGDIHFGFNISRVFTAVRSKETRHLRNKIW